MASSSEELDVVSVATGESEDSPLHSPASEELLEVLSRAVARLNIDWPAEKQEQAVKSKLDERFLPSRSAQPPRRALPFFPDLHTEVSRSWKRPICRASHTVLISEWSKAHLPVEGPGGSFAEYMEWVSIVDVRTRTNVLP
ncbi:hypothetical protein DPX16_1193 [Anabarilius grahami]|uniref:Uncharacterized protein n=1 Tax=Anabarilius grahami TaxID=495550 RepID=A0A3N0YUF5_ANAGA|nr:hypothetical protein DPX16_1193 [Anabarilius grahami]